MSDLVSSTSSHAETFVTDASRFSKEQVDVALAAELMRSGTMNERRLAAAVSNWTIHGSTSLASHLVERGLLDEPTCRRLERLAAERLESCRTESGAETVEAGGRGSEFVEVVDRLDTTGTLSRILGIREVAGANAAASATERRSEVRYRLLRQIGQGGLGRVWLAFDERLNRHVALKELTGVDPAALERFRREAELTGRLEHPGIVPVHHLGSDERTGSAFYAMRFLGKRTLHDEIAEYHERRREGDDDPMLIRRLLTAFVSVCQAVGHAHSRKVVHRDLKPENVAIDSFGQVIVIDWGLAKIVDDLGVGDAGGESVRGEVGSASSTIDGQVLGTPLFMAPEQAAGRIDDLDEKTDVYGLGAILFAILTGVGPHERETSETSPIGVRDLIASIVENPTPRARSVVPDVDPVLDAICAKAMARRSYARYESSVELAEEVQRWMAGEPVHAHPEGTAQRIGRWIRHHAFRSQVIAAMLIVATVAVATFGIATHQGRVARERVEFDEMRGRAREMELQLVGEAHALSQDVRFMSTLPPIQAIVQATVSDAEPDPERDEDVWRGRLETIFEGLLRANADYLAVTYARADPAEPVIVRVERLLSDAAFVRRVPRSRLTGFDRPSLLEAAAALSPGEIVLSIDRGSANGIGERLGVHLLAATPVYDDVTGELFGVVSIESNLAERLVWMLENLERGDLSVFVTDDAGEEWVSATPEDGVEVAAGRRAITEEIRETETFFADSSRRRLLDGDHGLVAVRIPLDPVHSNLRAVVVLRRDDE